MLFRKLDASRIDDLAEFFQRNRRPEIESQFNPFPLEEQSARDILDTQRKDSLFALYENEKIQAFSMLRGADEGYSKPSFGILVDHARQGEGLGRYLTDWTLLWADQQKVERIRLSVFDDNIAALRLYERLGFASQESVDHDGRTKRIMERKCPVERTALYTSLLALKPDEPLQHRLEDWRHSGLTQIEATWYPLTDDIYLASVGNQLIIHNYFPPEPDEPVLNLASPDPIARTRARDFYANRIELSQQLAAPWYSLHAGFINDPIGRDEHGFVFAEPTAQEASSSLSRFTREIETLAIEARQRNVSLLIENNVCSPSNKDKLLLVTPADFREFLAGGNLSNRVGILLDTGHMNVSAQTCGFAKESFLELAHNIEGMHLHQNDGSADLHLPCYANDWPIDFALEIQPSYASLEGRYTNLADLQKAYLGIYRRLNE